MRTIKEVLRLRFETNLSIRQIARSLKIGVGTVNVHLKRAESAGLSWPLPDHMDDRALESALFPNPLPAVRKGLVELDYATMHQELKRKGVTKQMLWKEYKQQHANRAYQYSQYCERYRRWVKTLQRSMRQVHQTGEKCFIDYCGPTIPVVDAQTGEILTKRQQRIPTTL